MATKQFYATRDFRYGTRMLRAGDPVEMDAPQARLYRALKAIAAEKPKAQRASTETVAEATAEAPKPKRAPRKRAAKKK